MRLLIAVLLLLIILPDAASAQQTTVSVRGIVRDNAGAPVPGAEAVMDGWTILTAADGRFVVDGIAPGLHPITIRGARVEAHT